MHTLPIDVIALTASRSPDLLKPLYRRRVEAGAHPLTGHCYVVSEAIFHSQPKTFLPCVIRHEGETHWFLRNKRTGEIVDATADQFSSPVPYHLSKGCGFLTSRPSRRAKTLLRRSISEFKHSSRRQPERSKA